MFKKFENKFEPWFWLFSLYFFVAYSYSFSAPFYLDDFTSVINNPLVIGDSSFFDFFTSINSRPVSYLTFWLDTRIFGNSPADYRLTNNIYHALTALSVGFLTYILLPVDFQYRRLVSSLAMGIFLLHPLHTQAVTYIVQRMTVLAALFSVLSLIFFIKFCDKRKILNLAISFAFLTLGFLSKQNAIMILPVFYVYDRLFIRDGSDWKFEKYATPCVLILLVSVIVFWGERIDALTRETVLVSRLDYFLAQGPILWSYIIKFFVPFGLHLEYSVDENTYSLTLSIISWLGHLLLLVGAIIYGKRLPLVSFGIFFYYIMHIVESSVIPISDFAFEHRTYLPNVGFVIALVGTIFFISNRLKAKYVVIFGIVVTTVFSMITAVRNYEWANPAVFYENEAKYNPNDWRVRNKQAQMLIDGGYYKKGIESYKELFKEFPGKPNSIGYLNMLIAYVELEDWEGARKIESYLAPKIDGAKPAFSLRFYINRIKRLYAQNDCKGVYADVEKVQQLFNGEAVSIIYRALCDVETGNIERAKKDAKALMTMDSDDPRIVELYNKAFSNY